MASINLHGINVQSKYFSGKNENVSDRIERRGIEGTGLKNVDPRMRTSHEKLGAPGSPSRPYYPQVHTIWGTSALHGHETQRSRYSQRES